MSKKEIDWFAIFLLISAMMVWASSFIALKSAISSLGSMSVIFGRMLSASLIFIFFIKSFLKLNFSKEDIKYIAIMVFLEPCLYFIFEAKALEYTSASQAGMLTSMMPLVTAIGAGFILKEKITKRLILGALLAILGAIWLSFSTQSSNIASNPILGNFLEFMAMICGAGYAISIRKLSEKFSALFLTAIQSFAGAIFFFPFFLWEYNTQEIHFELNAILWTLYLGIVVTLGGYGLFNLALSRVEASKASVYVNLIPVFTLLLAYLILGEKMKFVELIASAIILFGVIITQIPERFLSYKIKAEK